MNFIVKMLIALIVFFPAFYLAGIAGYYISRRLANKIFGPGKKIRTSDPMVPGHVLHQTELYPDIF